MEIAKGANVPWDHDGCFIGAFLHFEFNRTLPQVATRQAVYADLRMAHRGGSR